MVRQRDALYGEAVSVRELFTTADRRLLAPEFQRTYVWRSEGPNSHIARFWRDLARLRDEGTSEGEDQDSLFLGALVLQLIEPGGRGTVPLHSIIDGQQRIMTLYLVLTALAEAFQDAGDIASAQDIESEYLLVRTGAERNRPRVEPTFTDTRQFLNIMSCLEHPEPLLDRQAFGPEDYFLWQGWQAIRQEVRRQCSEAGVLSSSRLAELRDVITERIEVVEITLGIRHDPHEVYERLNNEGERLKIVDLVRNAVFLTVGRDAAAADRIFSRHWQPFEADLGRQDQDSYFFPYALIRDRRTTKASAYVRLRNYWKTDQVTGGKRGEEAAKQIMDDLRQYLPAYRAIVGTADPPGLPLRSGDTLSLLRRLNPPQTMYPYLMQLINRHILGEVDELQFETAIRIIDSFIVRRAVVGLGGTGLHTIFKDLWDRAEADPEDLLSRLQVRTVQFPDDDEFAESIRTTELYTVQRCAYILTEYERSQTRGDLPLVEPDDITIDHLLPQSASLEEWGGFTREQRDTLVNTWANLVPLSRKANAEKGAMTWAMQRQMMVDEGGTVFKTTREVFDKFPEKWDAEALGQRADALVEWALERWPKR